MTKRVILFGILFFALGCALVFLELFGNVVSCMVFHASHGNKMTFNNTRYLLPISWYVEGHNADYSGVQARRAGLSRGFNAMSFFVNDAGHPCAQECADKWAADMLTTPNTIGKPQLLSLNSAGDSLICVADRGREGGSLLCKSPAMNYSISFTGDDESFDQALAIIRSARRS